MNLIGHIFILLLIFCCNRSHSLNIRIIESQSYNSGHVMDSNWSNVVTTMGHVATISPQITLDNNSFFATTDILIISSGVINIPTNRIAIIQQFIQSGKPVYIQSEYLASYNTNQAFAYIINQFGGTFTWTNPFTGTLVPMNILGTFATTNNAITQLSYYWYSVSGVGDCNTVNFLSYGGEFHGFQYIPSNLTYGSMITCTDQDWINQNTSQLLMKNIITHLITPISPSNVSQVNLGNDTTLCQGQSIVLTGNTTGSSLWSNGATSSSINVSLPGIYWIQTGVSPCVKRDSVVILVKPYPVVNLGNDTTLCGNQSIKLQSGTASSYLWSNGATTSSINISSAGTYSVLASNAHCSATDVINVMMSQAPSVNFGTDTMLCNDQPIVLTASGANTYHWSNNTATSSISVSTSGTYSLQMLVGNCIYEKYYTVNISDCEIQIEMPNVFTPNNDGANDLFIPVRYKGITNATLRIFNRWGQELFYTNDVLSGWNGYTKGALCSDGTYFWIMNYTTQKEDHNEVKGFLTLLK